MATPTSNPIAAQAYAQAAEVRVASPAVDIQAQQEAVTAAVVQQKLPEAAAASAPASPLVLPDQGQLIIIDDGLVSQKLQDILARHDNPNTDPVIPYDVLQPLLTAPAGKKAAACGMAGLASGLVSPLVTQNLMQAKNPGVKVRLMKDLVLKGKGFEIYPLQAIGREPGRIFFIVSGATLVAQMLHLDNHPVVRDATAGAAGGAASGLYVGLVDPPIGRIASKAIPNARAFLKDKPLERIAAAYPTRLVFSGVHGAIWYCVYKGGKRYIYPDGEPKGLSGYLVLTSIAASAVGGVTGSLVAYPAQIVANQQTNELKCAREIIAAIYKKAGMKGFYVALETQLIQSAVRSGLIGIGLAAGNALYDKACKDWFDCHKHHLREKARGHDEEALAASRILIHMAGEEGVSPDDQVAKEAHVHLKRLDHLVQKMDAVAEFGANVRFGDGLGETTPSVRERAEDFQRVAVAPREFGANIRLGDGLGETTPSVRERAEEQEDAAPSEFGANVRFGDEFGGSTPSVRERAEDDAVIAKPIAPAKPKPALPKWMVDRALSNLQARNPLQMRGFTARPSPIWNPANWSGMRDLGRTMTAPMLPTWRPAMETQRRTQSAPAIMTSQPTPVDSIRDQTAMGLGL